MLNKSHHLYDRVTLCAVIYQMPVVSTKREGGEMERKESKRKSLTGPVIPPVNLLSENKPPVKRTGAALILSSSLGPLQCKHLPMLGVASRNQV